MLWMRALGVLLGLWVMACAAAQEPAGAPGPNAVKQAQPQTEGEPAADRPQEKLSDAERIARLRRTLEENERLLAESRARLEDPAGEYAKAEAEFTELDRELTAKKKELQKLQDEGRSDQAAALQTEIDALLARWELAKERFDLAIQERKTLQEQILTLELKIAQDREALGSLVAAPVTQPAETAPGDLPATSTDVPPEQLKPEAQPPAEAATGAGTAATAPEAAAAAPGEPGQAPTAIVDQSPAPLSEELQKAREEAQIKAVRAQTAEQEARKIKERINTLSRQIETGRRELATLRARAENADQERRTLGDLVQTRLAEGAAHAEIAELWSKIGEARKRAADAQREVDRKVDWIDQLQDELQQLQAEHIAALEQAEKARQEAAAALARLKRLQNPFSPANLLQWLLSHGPRIAGILVGMVAVLWLARVAEGRMVSLLARRGGPGTREERENRARTLLGVFHHAATLVVTVGGTLMVISELGFAVVPLLGAAGVVGLAVAFGAQNLVRDYFAGFMILLENQYGINDVIRVGDVAGLVERITLRVTVLRDIDGTVHFVPNGQISKVSNLTHGWSRAFFAIGVSYKEDVDRVMKVLVQLGKELRADPGFRQLILDDPEMLGVDEFTDSAVVIKFFIKTRPLQQWTVKRAMLRRIKKKFDELGIEIPFPHRTIYHRYEYGQTPPETPAEPSQESRIAAPRP